ncbi:MAG: hypothetical protein ABIG42_10785, partial [bacterium]
WYSDQRTYAYPNIEALNNSGMIQNGWAPKNLPRSSFNIIGSYSLDTNVCEGKCIFLEFELDDYLKVLFDEIEFARIKRRGELEAIIFQDNYSLLSG